MSHLPVYLILLPLFQALLMPLIRFYEEYMHEADAIRTSNISKIFVFFFLAIETWLVYLLFTSFSQPYVYQLGNWSTTYGVVLAIDSLTVWFIVLCNLGMLIINFYSFDHIMVNKVRYYTLMGILRAAITGLIFAGDYFNMYIFLELISITCTALISFYLVPKALWGAFQYLMFSAVGGALVFFGVVLIYAETGALNMIEVAKASVGESRILFAYGLIFIGNMIKVASFPFHVWLPSAHGEAEIPVSAMLSGLLLKANFYMLLRIFGHNTAHFNHFASLWIAFALLSIVTGHIGAMRAKQPKHILAYSSIVNMGYAGLVYCLSEPGNVYPALIVLGQHFVGKTFAFLSIGASTGQAKNRYIALYLRSIMVIAVLSLVGIPPLPGFWGKWFIIQNLFAEAYFWTGLLILLLVFPTVYYYRKFFNLLDSKPPQPYPCHAGKILAMSGMIPALVLFYYFLMSTKMI